SRFCRGGVHSARRQHVSTKSPRGANAPRGLFLFCVGAQHRCAPSPQDLKSCRDLVFAILCPTRPLFSGCLSYAIPNDANAVIDAHPSATPNTAPASTSLKKCIP